MTKGTEEQTNLRKESRLERSVSQRKNFTRRFRPHGTPTPTIFIWYQTAYVVKSCTLVVQKKSGSVAVVNQERKINNNG